LPEFSNRRSGSNYSVTSSVKNTAGTTHDYGIKINWMSRIGYVELFSQVFGIPTGQKRNLKKFGILSLAPSLSRCLRSIPISLEGEEFYAVLLHILYGFFHRSGRVIQFKVEEYLFPLLSELSNNLQPARDI